MGNNNIHQNTNTIGFLFTEKKMLLLVLFFALLELANVVLMKTSLNLLITLPEVLLVFYFLYIRNDPQHAIIFHVIFCLTAFDATSGSSEIQLLSYPEVKLFGPFTLSYIILGLIWIKVNKINIKIDARHTLYFKFYSYCKFLFTYGVIIGIIGVFLSGYRFKDDFLTPFIYLFTGLLYLNIFLRLFNKEFQKECYVCFLCLLIAAPLVSFFTFFVLNIRATYSVLDALIFNESFMLVPTLILGLCYPKGRKPLIILTLLLYFICVITAGRGGFFLNIAVSLGLLIIMVFFSDEIKHTVTAKYFRFLIPISIFCAVPILSVYSESGEGLGAVKFVQLLSLFDLFSHLQVSGVDFSNAANSPYVRIAEVLSLIHNGSNNIFALLFGHGYGGYFTDSLGLLANMDLSGGWSDEVINSGRFGRGHSFLPNTLLYNGLVGLFLIIRIGWLYLKKVSFTPVVFAAFTLFFYSFYFNASLFLAASFALFAAECKIKYTNINQGK